MLITPLLVNAHQLAGSRTTYDSFLSGNRKEISLPDTFMERMNSTFPPYGGGAIMYDEECEIDLEFKEGNFSQVRRIKVRRDELETSFKIDD